MADGKQARLTAFSKEQGFGRVEVPDEGELVFDASVAACSPDELVVGASVFVETGPSRVPGRSKVTSLWTSTAPGSRQAPVAATPEVERFASLGPYRLLLPPFWPDDSVKERGAVWTSVAKLGDVQCVLLLSLGGAADTKAKASLLAARGAGARVTRCDTEVLGNAFEGYRFDHGDEIEHLHVLTAHGDLLTAGWRGRPDPDAQNWTTLLLTMVSAAVVRRPPPALSPAKATGGGFWRRLFGG